MEEEIIALKLEIQNLKEQLKKLLSNIILNQFKID
mgnify:CR=1 FL=1